MYLSLLHTGSMSRKPHTCHGCAGKNIIAGSYKVLCVRVRGTAPQSFEQEQPRKLAPPKALSRAKALLFPSV